MLITVVCLVFRLDLWRGRNKPYTDPEIRTWKVTKLQKSATRKKSSTTTNARVSDGASRAEFSGVVDFTLALIFGRDVLEKQFCPSSNEAEVIRRTQKLEVFIYTSESAESSIVRFGMQNGT